MPFHLVRGNNEQRDSMGVIVTLREQNNDARVVLHKEGLKRAAMLEVAAWCDSQEGDWRVLCVSTPNTILRDVSGGRGITEPGRASAYLHSPEGSLLGLIGRRDLLDSKISASWDDTYRRNERGLRS